MSAHRFGGPWTERKLTALKAYLIQYQVIFKKNPKALKLKTIYVDAFAGTGERDASNADDRASLFGYGEEAKEFLAGSATVALSLEHRFDQYIFIDRKDTHIKALRERVRSENADVFSSCVFVHGDANEWLQAWCRNENWDLQRAVVFLDPYGMNVTWETVEAIARTEAIDLWVLFPFAIGANRMMPGDQLPEKDWGMRLTKAFGTIEWTKRFYARVPTADLFGDDRTSITKIAGVDAVLGFYLERLRTIFPHVVEKPMILYNSNNTAMYALCFAAGNLKGGKTALKIAEHLTRTR